MRKLSLLLVLMLLLSSIQVFAVETETAEDVEVEEVEEVAEEAAEESEEVAEEAAEESEEEAVAEEEEAEEIEEAEETEEVEEPAEPVNAEPSKKGLKFLVNGEEVVLEAYLINENNYLKLRDIAMLVSGSEKQFNVTWDQETGQVILVSDEAYTEVGGELAEGDGLAKEAIESDSEIYKDGLLIDADAYLINQNNYFKLRDITKLFNIGTGWDGETNSVIIDTSMDYEMEETEEAEEVEEVEEVEETEEEPSEEKEETEEKPAEEDTEE